VLEIKENQSSLEKALDVCETLAAAELVESSRRCRTTGSARRRCRSDYAG